MAERQKTLFNPSSALFFDQRPDCRGGLYGKGRRVKTSGYSSSNLERFFDEKIRESAQSFVGICLTPIFWNQGRLSVGVHGSEGCGFDSRSHRKVR